MDWGFLELFRQISEKAWLSPPLDNVPKIKQTQLHQILLLLLGLFAISLKLAKPGWGWNREYQQNAWLRFLNFQFPAMQLSVHAHCTLQTLSKDQKEQKLHCPDTSMQAPSMLGSLRCNCQRNLARFSNQHSLSSRSISLNISNIETFQKHI